MPNPSGGYAYSSTNQSSVNPTTGSATYNNQALGPFPLTPQNIGLNHQARDFNGIQQNFAKIENALMRIQAQSSDLYKNGVGQQSPGSGGGDTITGISDTKTASVPTGITTASSALSPSTATFVSDVSWNTSTCVMTKTTGTVVTGISGTFLTSATATGTATFLKTVTITTDMGTWTAS